MKRWVWLVVALGGCATDLVIPPSCEPVIAVDDVHSTHAGQLSVLNAGTSYCVRVDASHLARPHFEVSSPGFADATITLRDLGNEVMATGTTESLGGLPYGIVRWDPAGDTSYDVLVAITPPASTIAEQAYVTAELSAR